MAVLALLSKLVLAPATLAVLILVVNSVRGFLSHRAKHRLLRPIRGPERSSFVAGNLQELYGTDGLPFYEALSAYGSVVKLHGLFGVCIGVERVGCVLTRDIGCSSVHNGPSRPRAYSRARCQ